MFDRKKQDFEIHLKTIFQEGYKHAAMAFSKIMQTKIYYNYFHHTYYSIKDDNTQSRLCGIHRNGSVQLVTTEVKGNIFGKSYLLLNQHEFDIITNSVHTKASSSNDMKLEIVKEIDNILSGAVISRLSENLNLNIYGDVPHWFGHYNGCIMNLIKDDFSTKSENIYINASYFSSDTYSELQPFFIWVLPQDIMELVHKPVYQP